MKASKNFKTAKTEIFIEENDNNSDNFTRVDANCSINIKPIMFKFVEWIAKNNYQYNTVDDNGDWYELGDITYTIANSTNELFEKFINEIGE